MKPLSSDFAPNADSSLFAKSEESLKAWLHWRIDGFLGADAPSLGTEKAVFRR